MQTTLHLGSLYQMEPSLHRPYAAVRAAKIYIQTQSAQLLEPILSDHMVSPAQLVQSGNAIAKAMADDARGSVMGAVCCAAAICNFLRFGPVITSCLVS